MELMVSLGLVALSFVYGFIIYRAARKPVVPAYASQALVACHSLALTTLLFISAGMLVQFCFAALA